MKKNALILTLLMTSAAAYTFYADFSKKPEYRETVQSEPVEKHQVAPDFSFVDLKGKSHSLSDFKGRVVVLNFWASWCAPCVIEFPQMLEFAALMPGKAVFLFLSQDDSYEDIHRFLEKYGQDLPAHDVYIAQDKNQKIARTLYQTYKLPETYLIGPEGTIEKKIIGADISWAGKEMQETIRRLYEAGD